MKILEKLAARTENAYDSSPALIAFLGDSVTHGCFDVFMNRHGNIDCIYAPLEGYAAQLQRRLNTLYPAAAASILNAGVSGDSAEGGLARLERDVISRKPDLVIVNFALNDSMSGIEKLPAYEKHMTSIMEKILASGAECILLTPNHMCAYVDPVLKDKVLVDIAEKASAVQNGGVLAAYVETAKAAAGRIGVPVADAHAVWDSLSAHGVDTTAMLSNHINHPTVAAHGIFVEAIMPKLLDM